VDFCFTCFSCLYGVIVDELMRGIVLLMSNGLMCHSQMVLSNKHTHTLTENTQHTAHSKKNDSNTSKNQKKEKNDSNTSKKPQQHLQKSQTKKTERELANKAKLAKNL
jgi:hypothetical protein